MGKNWRIGSLFGIPLYLDSSWFLILALVTFTNAGDMQLRGLVDSNFIAWSAGLISALLLFASVLLHELGHSLVALKQGIKVNSITLFLFGGLAAIERESQTPGEAFWVAIAGPGVSLLLWGLFVALGNFTTQSPLIGYLAQDLARINLILAIFNLIPGLPLDGGQVLKAAVWKATGDRVKGVYWASVTGQWLGWLGICLGLFIVFLGGDISGLWLALVGWFILQNASAYNRLTQMQESLLKLKASEVMTRQFRVVDAHLSLSQFASTYVSSEVTTPMAYYAASEGRYRGLVQVKDLQSIERSYWDQQTLLDIVHPFGEITSVNENTSLVEVIQRLEGIQEGIITVLSPSGAVGGVIDRGDIVRTVAKKLNLPVADTEINRIKMEGNYPTYLQLDALAKTIKPNF